MTQDEAIRQLVDAVPPALAEQADGCLGDGDPGGWLGCEDSTKSLRLVWEHSRPLKLLGLYERALLTAFEATRTNNHGWPAQNLRRLFEDADRRRLRKEGDPLPGPGPFQLYRGVGGRGPARRISTGISWTGTRELAEWFAQRAGWFGLHDPGVYSVTVNADDVFAYWNQRSEDEFLVLLPRGSRPKRVDR